MPVSGLRSNEEALIHDARLPGLWIRGEDVGRREKSFGFDQVYPLWMSTFVDLYLTKSRRADGGG